VPSWFDWFKNFSTGVPAVLTFIPYGTVAVLTAMVYQDQFLNFSTSGVVRFE